MTERPENDSILVDKLGYSIVGKKILNDISLRIKAFRMTGLIGPNGSGKTTLLKHLYRVLVPASKTVFIRGRDIRDLSYREASRILSVLKQEGSPDFEFSVLEMVLLGRSPYLKYYESYSGEDLRIAQMALKCVGMDTEGGRSFLTLSGGEKQRVLLARSIAQQSDILLLDEPTNHLDVHYQWALMELLKELNKTTLSVFHELNLACAYCDYLYVLKHGAIVCAGTPQEIITRELLRDVFSVDAEVVTTDNQRPYILFQGTAKSMVS